MAASLALHPAAKPRDRSIEARRAARREKFERKRVIVDFLNRGVPVVEIAERIGVTEKRMRALVKDILARRMPAAPEDYAALQASRLNEALFVSYGAMSDKNLKAVALVVRIVRELDRYHGCRRRPARPPSPRSGEGARAKPAGWGVESRAPMAPDWQVRPASLPASKQRHVWRHRPRRRRGRRGARRAAGDLPGNGAARA